MSYTATIKWETLRSIDSSSLTGSYQAIGTPLANPSYIIKFISTSSTLVTLSIDSETDVDVIPANGGFVYDETKYVGTSIQFIPKGTQFFVKGTAGTGRIYMITQYIKTN